MVTLRIGGKSVSWADAEKLFADGPPAEPVEIRNAAGHLVAVCEPVDSPYLVEALPKGRPARGWTVALR